MDNSNVYQQNMFLKNKVNYFEIYIDQVLCPLSLLVGEPR